MPAEEKIEPGKYQLDLTPAPVPFRLVGAEFSAALDQPAALTVTLAVTPEETAKLTTGKFATEASLTWAETKLFKGYLLQAEVPKSSQVRLHFRDSLFSATKILDNSFVQQHTLRDCLSKFASQLKLSPQFYGDFSMKLPSFNLGGQSALDHLNSLSYHFGFHFVANSASNELAFIKLGSQTKSRSFDGKTHAGEIRHSQSVERTYNKSQLRHFDATSMQPQDRKLGDSDLYSPLGGLKDHAGFKTRAGWKLAEGSVDTHVADGFHFESSEALMRNQLSKTAMGQEQLSIDGFKLVALPGEKVSVKGAPIPDLQNGDYLVNRFSLRLNSAIPAARWELIRA